MLIKGLMSNLSLVKESGSWLFVWAVTLATGLCRHVVVHSFASQSWDYWTPFLSGCHSQTMAAFHEHELATTTTDAIIRFAFLSAQKDASFEAFYTLWFWLMLLLSSMTEQINLADELLRHFYAFAEILKVAGLFCWFFFLELLQMGVFCNRVELVKIM